jgi:hypothetical protein
MPCIKFLWILPLFLAFGCRTGVDPKSEAKFESAHSRLLDARIDQGIMHASNAHKPTLLSEISEQLYYLRGQLQEINGISNNPYAKIEITDITGTPQQGYVVRYRANMQIAWPEETPLPSSFDAFIPRFGSEAGRTAFFDRYSRRCRTGGDEIAARYYWYYYRIQSQNCTVRTDIAETTLSSPVSFPVSVVPSSEQTQGKFPEYDKIWDDEKLVITFVRGMSSHSSPLPTYDEGANHFNLGIRRYLDTWGPPSSGNLSQEEIANEDFDFARNKPQVQMKWDTIPEHPGKILDVMGFFLEEISAMPSAMRVPFNQRVLESDIVVYAGHSGLGGNIRTFAGLPADFTRGRYQLFVINGCITYSYVDNTLLNRHGTKNNAAQPTKYLDVITNAMPAYFMDLNQVDFAIIDSTFNKLSYKDMLAKFPRVQRANVIGEQDNAFPQAFVEDLPTQSACNPSWGQITTCLNPSESSFCPFGTTCAKKACKAGKLLDCPGGCTANQTGSQDDCRASTQPPPAANPCKASWGNITTCLNQSETGSCAQGAPCAQKACLSGKIMACPGGCEAKPTGSPDQCNP